MAREVDKRKTRKALRRLKRASERAQVEGGPGLTEWEKGFVAGVTERLETYGSAFRDPTKGALDEALSQRQTHVARVLERKSRPKKKPAETAGPGAAGEAASKADGKADARPRSTFKRKPPVSRARVRDVNEDAPEPDSPVEAIVAPEPSAPGAGQRSRFRVISGGRKG